MMSAPARDLFRAHRLHVAAVPTGMKAGRADFSPLHPDNAGARGAVGGSNLKLEAVHRGAP